MVGVQLARVGWAAERGGADFERLRFVAISARNLDEFFAKRVGAIKRQAAAGVENWSSDAGRDMWTPEETLQNVAVEVERQVDVQAALLEDHIVPRLREEHDVSLEQYDDLDPELQRKLEKYFEAQIEPARSSRHRSVSPVSVSRFTLALDRGRARGCVQAG